MENTTAVTAFVVSLGLFAFTSFFVGRKITNEKDLFTASNSKGSALSVVAGNVTLGTGLFYYMTLLTKGWIPALIVPFGVLLGYLWLAKAVKGVNFKPNGLSTLLDFTQQRENGSLSVLSKAFLLLIPIVFLLIIAAEIYIATPIIGQSLGLSLDDEATKWLAVGIAFCGVLYGIVGGLRGVIFSDRLQFGLAISMIVALVLLSLFPSMIGLENEGKPSALQTLFEIPSGFNSDTYFIIGLAFISALTTQFYNIVNLGMGSSFDASKSSKMFVKVSFITAATLLGLLIVGALLSGSATKDGSGLEIIIGGLLAQNLLLSNIILCIIIFGMMSVLFSSIDSVVILCAQQIRSRFRGDSGTPQNTPLLARLSIGLAGALALGIVIVFFNFKPEVLPLLFTVILPLSLFAPIILFGFLGRSGKYDTIYSTKPFSGLFFIVILSVWVWAITDTLSGSQTVVNYSGTCGVMAMFLIGAVDFLYKKKRGPNPRAS